ncbi:MAG: hypothetical protein PHU32_03795 [Candidatus ainarchaeum sp.]|nr:hypothetical protein [Candidatus ainarchaeum sp.]MDD3940518.1 hypothetical protein [Candidatus Paceibacterota bacterium]MDD4468100.1 hypothetical protein [Candidatus ainarchaeum sp.]
MNNKIPKIKKNISDFLTSEEGSIDKKNAANLAITAIVLGSAFYGLSVDAHNSFLINDDILGKHSSFEGTHSVPYHTSNLLNDLNQGGHNSHTSVPWSDWSDWDNWDDWDNWSDAPYSDHSDYSDVPYSDYSDIPWSDWDNNGWEISEAPDPYFDYNDYFDWWPFW